MVGDDSHENEEYAEDKANSYAGKFDHVSQ